VRLGIGGGFLKFGNYGNFSTASGYAGERNQDFATSKNSFVSYKQIPTVTSEKRVQALDTEDTALSASTADYEFHPDDRVN
jgi:hypothetical protein